MIAQQYFHKFNSVQENEWVENVFVRQILTRVLAWVESEARTCVNELFLWFKQQKPIWIYRAFLVTNKRCPILPMSLFNARILSKYSVHYAWFIQAYASNGQKPVMQIATCTRRYCDYTHVVIHSWRSQSSCSNYTDASRNLDIIM